MTCRLDTAEEVSIYEAGGMLQRFAQDFLEVEGGMNEPRPPDQDPRHLHAWRHQKGVFFRLEDLPPMRRCRAPRAMRC